MANIEHITINGVTYDINDPNISADDVSYDDTSHQTQMEVTNVGDAVEYLENNKANYSHSHGYITSGGDCTTNVTIASGDRIMINDESASKIKNSSITFGSSTTQYLANDGTWQTLSVPTITSGTSDPSGGSNGDIYIKYES